jgi:hypothetical protein
VLLSSSPEEGQNAEGIKPMRTTIAAAALALLTMFAPALSQTNPSDQKTMVFEGSDSAAAAQKMMHWVNKHSKHGGIIVQYMSFGERNGKAVAVLKYSKAK